MTESTQTSPSANPGGGPPTSPTNPYEEGAPNTPVPSPASPTNPYEEGGPVKPAVAPKPDEE
jgi:hypothetical protein